jgi:hypothetical protein
MIKKMKRKKIVSKQEKAATEPKFICGGKDTTYNNLRKRAKELKEHRQE